MTVVAAIPGSSLLTFGSFVFFTALVALASWWRTRELDNADPGTYYLAGRKLPWIQVAGALLLTNLSTEQLLGLNGAAALHGMSVMAWEVMSVFALVAMAWYFLPRYWRGSIVTVPQFLEQRFDASTRFLMGAVMLITLVFNLLPFVLYSGALAMSAVFRLPELLGLSENAAFWLMAFAIAGAGALYVVLGGMKAVAISDTLYGAGLVGAGLLIPVLGLIKIGEGSFSAGLSRLLADQAPRFNPIGAENGNVPFSTLFTGMLCINLFYWCTNQLIVQRSFGAASFAEAQKGILATAALKLLGPFYLVLPGLIAVQLFGAAALGNGDVAYARLVDAVMPPWLMGFFAAMMLGSIISSFNGGLHSAVTLFSLDVIRSRRTDASDAQRLCLGKAFALFVCVIALVACPLLAGSSEGVFTMMKRLMAAFKLPLLAVVLAGILSRRVSPGPAKAALLGGVGVHFLLEWALGSGRFGVTVHWLHLSALNVVLLCAFMLVAGTLFRRPLEPKAIVSRAAAAELLVPWSGLRIASLAVCGAAIALYFCLWLVARPV